MKKTNTFSLFRIPNLAFCNAVSTLKTIQTKPNNLNHIYGYSSVRYVWPHLKTCFSEFNHIKKIPRKIWRWNKKNEKCHLWFYILNLELFGNTENLFRRTSFRNSIQDWVFLRFTRLRPVMPKLRLIVNLSHNFFLLKKSISLLVNFIWQFPNIYTNTDIYKMQLTLSCII